MPAYKDKAKGTWYASFYYEDWTGKKVKKMKRGFPTKREALEWERTFLQQQTADLEMTFENFVAVYVADMKGRIKENTWGTKEHILYKKLVPYFGKRKMCDIHSKEVIAWQNEMLGYRDKNGKPYSPVYGRVRESNIRLSDRLQEVKLENKAMRQVSADYERVKRAFGPEQVDRILEAAYQQEHAEKERKRAAKSKIRIDAR